ncbi:hypothetical protein GCM10018787_05270 [Streptomyces thermodiastaticus]|nr:hypothetical protein GCM10018787_05270 [Streptomyces thermodiastaticus]
MVGSGSPLAEASSLRPTSPPASAIRSSRTKARSSDCTPPLEEGLAESLVLALDVGTARSFRGWQGANSSGEAAETRPVESTFCLPKS